MKHPAPIAVVPAFNEEFRVGGAIAALRDQGVEVLVVANGCSDRTEAVARAAGARVMVLPTLAGGVGEARARGCAEALRCRPRTPMLLTSDADCRVAPGTVAVLARALGAADAAAGRVVPDPTEFAALPDHVRLHGDFEDLRDALLSEISARIRPSPHDPLPRHGQAPGALLAFRPAAYLAAGGFARLACSEDRDIVRRLCDAGLSVAHPWDAVVIASCRLEGRAAGGMADTIARRAASDLTKSTRRLSRQCDRLATITKSLRVDGPAAVERICDSLAETESLRRSG